MRARIEKHLKNKVVSAAVILVALLIIIFIFRGTASRGFAIVQRPLVGAGTWITDHTSVLFGSASQLNRRLEEVENQRNDLAVDFSELEQLRHENTQLKEQLSFLSRQSEQNISAAIISRSSSSLSSTFIIDRGKNDGIIEGSPVIVGNGYLVGKITSVMPTTSTVTATTDTKMATAATLLNESRTIGIAEGVSSRLIKLSFIPHDEQIGVNDLVITSGLENGIPSGLIIGIVNTVETDATLPFQNAIVEPLVDINEHRIVSVLLGREL